MAFDKIDWLIIAEKKNQATDICNGLFDLGKPSGTFEVGGRGGTDISSILKGTVVVSRAQGHLYEMLYPNDQDEKYSRKAPATVDDWGVAVGGGWKSDEEMLSVYPVKLDTVNDNIKFKAISPKHKKLATNLKQLFKVAKNVVVSTDADPEGEMIFRNWAKNNLGKKKLDDGHLYRVHITTLTPDAIRKAFKETLERYDSMSGTLGDYYKGLAPKGYARSIADYEFGMTFTLLGHMIAEKEGMNSKGNNGVWGRLKNTILGHVRNAEHKYDSFVPSSVYRVDLKTKNGVLLKGNDEITFKTRAEAEDYIAKSNLPKSVDVTGTKETRNIKSPKLYSRAELLIAAKKKINKSSDWPSVLQTDYEIKKILGYPRTDSQYIAPEDYASLQAYLDDGIIRDLLTKEIEKNKEKVTDGTDSFKLDGTKPANKRFVDASKAAVHVAITPNSETTITDKLISSLTDEERDLFLMDLYHTMAMFMSDSVEVKSDVSAVEAPDGSKMFNSSFASIQEQGWRLLTGDIKKAVKLPELGQQDVEYVASEVKATRPNLLDDSTLLGLLKKRNEGTSATRDATIAMMIKNKGIYKQKDGKLRVNTELAPIVDEMLQKGWIDMNQTAAWQEELDNVNNDEQGREFIERVRVDTKDLQHKIMQNFKIEAR